MVCVRKAGGGAPAEENPVPWGRVALGSRGARQPRSSRDLDARTRGEAGTTCANLRFNWSYWLLAGHRWRCAPARPPYVETFIVTVWKSSVFDWWTRDATRALRRLRCQARSSVCFASNPLPLLLLVMLAISEFCALCNNAALGYGWYEGKWKHLGLISRPTKGNASL